MKDKRQQPRSQRGSTLIVAVAALLMLLGMAGFAIDALTLYVSRTDAQRAADAAALAGAKIFVSSACTTSANCTSAATQALVRKQAEGVGAQNKVFGQYASIADADVTFPPSPTGDLNNPLVQVNVHQVVPTFFMGALSRMLGNNVSGVTVAAKATAEAFNPSGSNIPFATSCVKPWLIPNCDPTHATPKNGVCAGGNFGYLVNPTNNTISNPGVAPGGVIGMSWQLHSAAAPSQYGEASFDGSESKSEYRTNIETCSPSMFQCGSVISTINGKAVGPTDQGVDTLINASSDGANNGQDTIDTSTGPPFTIKAGANNPFFPPGTTISPDQSTSVVTVPVYDGAPLCPGKSCGATQTVVGFLQLFVKDVIHKGPDDQIDTVILNAVSCGSGSSSGGGPPVTGGGATLIPVRLVRNP
ncbi:MAG TPA: pilus assembly protein TadG-related protein [Terriglobales bacterium]|nr:pilus assembly protein TadG-related protein [Terriglobales bacterium]